MKLVLPRTVLIGNRRYRVVRDPKLSRRLLGQTVFPVALIRLTPKAVSQRELEYAFWHEVTHGILHEMGSPLTYNERWVVKFSTMLANLIKKMRFL